LRRLEDPVAVGIDLSRDPPVVEVVGVLDPRLPGPRGRERGDAGQPVAVIPGGELQTPVSRRRAKTPQYSWRSFRRCGPGPPSAL
jgi:hypothetical protein